MHPSDLSPWSVAQRNQLFLPLQEFLLLFGILLLVRDL